MSGMRLMSKKIKSVIEANAKAGKYRTTYVLHMDMLRAMMKTNFLLLMQPAASVVRRIFEMRSQGISPRHIADKSKQWKAFLLHPITFMQRLENQIHVIQAIYGVLKEYAHWLIIQLILVIWLKWELQLFLQESCDS